MKLGKRQVIFFESMSQDAVAAAKSSSPLLLRLFFPKPELDAVSLQG
jgi:hypothetical protein